MTIVFEGPPHIGEKVIDHLKGTHTSRMLQWLTKLVKTLNQTLSGGVTVTITTAPLTSTGTQGSMTFVNGILTSQTQAT